MPVLRLSRRGARSHSSPRPPRTGLRRRGATATSITIEIVTKPADQIGFAVHPRRWVVERFFAWISRKVWRSLLVARRTVLNEMRSIENVVRAVLREAGRCAG